MRKLLLSLGVLVLCLSFATSAPAGEIPGTVLPTPTPCIECPPPDGGTQGAPASGDSLLGSVLKFFKLMF